MLRAYRRALWLPVPIGAALGAVPGFAFAVGGNPDFVATHGAGGVLSLALLGAVVGVGTAVLAQVGGIVAFLLRRDADRAVERARTGAALAVVAGWLALGIVAAPSLGVGFVAVGASIGIVLGFVASLLATLLLRADERHAGVEGRVDVERRADIEPA